MHVILLGPREPVPPLRGGAIEKLTWQLARHLVRRGTDVSLIASGEDVEKEEEVEGVDIYYVSKPVRGSLFYVKTMPIVSHRMRKIVERIVATARDGVIIHSVYFYNLLAFLDLREPPIVVTEFEHYPWIREYMYHQPFLSPPRKVRWEADVKLRIILANIILPRTRAIIAVSRYQRKKIADLVPAVERRITVIYNFVDTEHFRPLKADELRNSLAGGAELVGIFVGRLTPHKGLHILLKALARLPPDARRRIRLVIVGPRAPGFGIAESPGDIYVGYLNYVITRYDLKNSVVFTGAVTEEDLPRYYSAADILIHPSLVEAFGLTLIEAMASGKPVLAFNIPPLNEIVNEEVGILVNPSISDLAKALEALVNDGATLRNLSRKARLYAERFSIDNIIEKYISLYKNILFSVPN